MGDTGTDETAADRTTTESDAERVLVLNPVSGTGDHVAEVRSRAADHGFEVRATEGEGDAIEFAREAAAAGASVVAAAGGDGTLNEVVRGIAAADRLDDVRFGVVPAGTGNNFAENVGVREIAHAFQIIEDGETREIDLGEANGGVFLNSCIAGLTADASAETDSEMKSRLGVLAYVLTTLRRLSEFDGMSLRVDAEGVVDRAVEPDGVDTASDANGSDPASDANGGAQTPDANGRGQSWDGTALLVLIGNARRFPQPGGGTQANVEDGLLDVTIVEGAPMGNALRENPVQRLLRGGEATITRLQTPSLSIEALDDEPVQFSLDGEIVSTADLDVSTRRRSLSLFVGDGYDPDPPT
jgi:diacylglycerol kinase family enzyme